MDIKKKNLTISCSDFWYDLTEGYLDPDKICANPIDASRVKDAIETLQDFEQSCDEQIEGFVQ